MYERRYSRDDILKLFRVIDWIIRLPAVLAEQFSQELYEYEESKKMPYVTSIEQIGIEKGMQQGMQQGMRQGMQQGEAAVLARLLIRRFGPLSQEARDRLQQASLEQLECWTDRILDAQSIEDLFDGRC